MLKHLQKLLLIALLCVPWVTQAQELGDYTFSTDTSYAKWVDMSSATQILTCSNNDGLASSVQSIGFTFPFGDNAYTQFSVNTDGNLRLGGTVTGTSNYSSPFSSSNANINNPKINAFGCDGYGVSGTHYVKKLLTEDDNGDDLLVVEFCMGTFNSSTRNELYKWQIHLYANGDIEIVFPDASGIPTTAPAVAHQCGLCVSSADGWIITSADNTATHFTNGTSTQNSSGTWFDATRYYRFERPIVTCPKPAIAFVTDISAYEASISWEYGGEESEWIVIFNDTTIITGVTDTFYTFTDLNPNTTYTFGVRAVCDIDDTSAIRQITFTTPCVAMSLPYMQNFDALTTSTTAATGVHVPCWDYTMLNASYATATYQPQVYYSSSYANSGSYSLRLYGVAYTALPPMEAPIDSLQIMFSKYTTSTSYGLQVGALEADGTFVPLATFDSDPSSSHVDHTVYLNNYTGNSHTIAFYNYYINSTTGYGYNYIDDIVVDYLPTCSPVSNVDVETTVGAAVVSWTAGSVGEYYGAYVEYKPDTATEWSSMTVEGLSAVITGLQAATDYNVRVKGLCDGGNDTARLWATADFSTGDFGCAVVDPDTYFSDTIGNGTSTNNYLPSYSFYNYGLTQQIFTAAEIGHGGSIDNISFMWSTVAQQRTYEIYMGHVSSATASDFVHPSDLTLVYNGGPITLAANVWTTFNLTTPFNYNGSDNLVVILRDLTGSYVSGNYGYVHSAASGAARYAYQDSGPYDPYTYSGGTALSVRNNIILGGAGCLVQATCAAPAAAVYAVDTTSVTLSWAPGYDETSWEVWYRQGNTGGFTVVDDNVSTMEYTVNNLQPGTEYEFKVVNICGTDTFASGILTVFTDCAPIDNMFDNFESYGTGASAELNPCWYRGIYNQTTNYPYVNTVDGNKVLYFYTYVSGSTHRYCWLTLPEMRDSLNTYEVEFDMRKYSTTVSYATRIIVGAMTDPTNMSTFDTIATFNASTYGVWESFYLSLENYHGNGKYIALLAPDIDPADIPGNTSTYTYNYVYLDNLYVGHRSSCPKPTRFHARDITANTAVLAWDSVADYMSVSVKYNTVNDINSAQEVTTTDASVMINGLTANTTYFCWITAQCAEENSRTMTCSFTTTDACNPVVNLTVTEATANIASITWESDEITPASSYIFEWKEADSTVWNSIATNNTYYQLTNLTQGTEYNVRVYAECSDDTAAAATITFTTTTPGTIGSNEGTYYLPTYPYYEYSISEQMWTANELAEYGDTINGIYFNAASAITDRDMQIWVVDTTLADLSTTNYVPSTAMTLVMDTTYDIVAGWNYFPFDAPYVRDLSKNLVVLVYDHTGDYESFDGFYATTSAINSLYDYQDGTPYSTTDLSSLTAEGVRAMMRLDATMVQPSCLAPHPVVSNVTDNSVSLVWVAGLNETAWSVDYRGLSDTAWTTVVASTTTTSITVNGLNPSTSYVFRIGALCSDNTMYAAVRGTTSCGAFTVPYFEDFNVYSSGEYDFDPCWYKGNTNNSNMPYIVNVTNVGPDMLMPQGSYVIFPQMNVPVSQLQLRCQFLAAREDIYALVGVCSHPRDILSMTVIDTLWGPNVGEVNWNTVPMDSYTGADGYIAIYSNYNQSYIDNINIEMIPMCGLADSIEATNITTTTADLQWLSGNNAANYIVEYGPLGGNTFTTVPATGTTLSLSGLQHSTDYLVNIYSVCPSLNDTSIASSYRFTTSCDTVSLPYFEDFDHCNAPSLTATGILPNCWNYMWAPTNTSYSGASYIPQIYSGTSYSHSGQYSLRTYGKAIMTLPEMPVDVNQLQISLHDYVTSTGYYNLVIGVCDSNWGNFAQSFVPVDTILAVNSHTDITSYKLATYTGSGRFIAFTWFYVSGSYTYDYAYHYIDDISVDYLPSCLPVYDLHSTANTSTSVTMDWSVYPGSTATEWELSYSTTPLADPSTGNVVNVVTHPYTITGLADTTNYYVYVRNICNVGDTSIWTGFGPVHPGEWVMRANQLDTVHMCGGIIYDDGGATGSYSNSQSSTLIIYPSAPGNLVQIQGTFAGEGCCDYLGIYDGVGTSGTEFFYGNCTSSGTTMNLGPFVSTNGPITISFSSDGSVVYPGFAFNVSCISTSCMVTNLTLDPAVEQQSTALALMWDSVDDVVTYEVEYGTPGFTVGTGTFMTANTNHAVISGLDALTNYEVYVRSLCSGNDTGSWAHQVFMTAMCDNVNELYSYNDTLQNTTSSSYGPIGYSLYNYSYVQTLVDSAQFAGLTDPITAFAFKPTNTTSSNYYTHMTVWMANVPEANLSAGAIIPDDSVHVFVPVITDADFNFTEVGWQLHGFDSAFTWDGHSNVLIAVKRDHGTYSSSGSFSAHSTTGVMTRYYYQDSGPISYTSPSATSSGTGNYVGDMKFYSCGAACSKPSLVPVTDLSYNGATLNWNSSATDFEVAVKAATDATWPAETAVTTNSFAVTGLSASTQYQYRVRAICDATEGLISEWAMGTFVTDSLPCFDPSDLHTSAIGYTTATLAWTANGVENQWSIHVWNNTFDQEYPANANPQTITGLTPEITYYAAVKSICGNGEAESDYSDTIQFTTATCEQVTGVAVSNITNTTAVVNWNGNATHYEVEYGDQNFDQGTGTRVTVDNATSYTITGLDKNSTYSVFVRAICETGVYGAWSTQVDFTTTNQGISAVEGGMNVSIYPNPTSSSTTIALSGVNGDVAITVVDLSGRVVMSDSMSCEGDCEKTMEVSGLAQGAYFVRVSGEGVNMVKKLVVK